VIDAILEFFFDRPRNSRRVVIVVIFILVLYGAIQEEKDWDAYAAAHHCKITKSVKGQTTLFPPITYTCDDGQEFTRSH
jgi:hypothetical protein